MTWKNTKKSVAILAFAVSLTAYPALAVHAQDSGGDARPSVVSAFLDSLEVVIEKLERALVRGDAREPADASHTKSTEVLDPQG